MPFVYEAFTALFTAAPRLKYVGYLAPKSTELFSPFSGPRYLLPDEAAPNETQQQQRQRRKSAVASQLISEPLFRHVSNRTADGTHNLFYLTKNYVLPKITVRKARVEDCDDLVPMLKRHKVIITRRQLDRLLNSDAGS
jgi:hypothetical protein